MLLAIVTVNKTYELSGRYSRFILYVKVFAHSSLLAQSKYLVSRYLQKFFDGVEYTRDMEATDTTILYLCGIKK